MVESSSLELECEIKQWLREIDVDLAKDSATPSQETEERAPLRRRGDRFSLLGFRGSVGAEASHSSE